MSTIVVFGGTGYTGGNVVREAAARGHQVISVSRSAPADPVEGVRYEAGPVEGLAPQVIPGAEAVVVAMSPRGDLAGRLVKIYGDIAAEAAAANARLVVIGGFASLRPAPGEPRFVDEMSGQFRDEAMEMDAVRVMLEDSAAEGPDWVYVSPARGYGAWAAGERTGTYRVGGDVALFDVDGGSNISGADFALALVQEIEHPAHHRTHIGVAYLQRRSDLPSASVSAGSQ
jgi:putative NADH-flavin reductase